MMQQIILTEPVPGTIINCPINTDDMIIGLMFSPDFDTMNRSHGNLEFHFPNQGKVVLEGFFEHYPESALPYLILDDGAVLGGKDVLAAMRAKERLASYRPEAARRLNTQDKHSRGML